MRAASHRPRRIGLTLIELVVVVGIIVILLGIGAAFLPGLQGNQKVQTGVDRIAQWLLIAKNRAKHDGLPTGLRFLLTNNPTADPAPPNGNPYLTVSQFMYVQQPDPLFGDPGASTLVSAFTIPDLPLTNPPTYKQQQAQVLFTNNPDFVGGDAANPLVQAGDYLELFGGGTLYQIASVQPSVLNPADNKTYVALQLNTNPTTLPGAIIPGPNGTTSWRIIRQPRRLPGEDVLTLPQDIVVDLSVMPLPVAPAQVPVPITSWATPRSQNVPARAGSYEILFSPSGGVIGQTAQTGKILLWVRDATVPSPTEGDTPQSMQGNPTLVSIQVRGGFLGTYPVVPNTDAASYPGQFYTDALRGRSGF